VLSIGLTPVVTLTTDIVLSAAPAERAGAASALSETSSEFGGALGIAVLGSIVTAIYRGAIDGAIPGGISPEAAAAARGTLGGAVAVAAQLPAELGAQLLGSARTAYAASFEVVAAISVGTVLCAAVLAAVLLRRVGEPVNTPRSAPD